MDVFVADAMFRPNKTMDSIRDLRSGEMARIGAAEARIRMKRVAGILHSREKGTK